MANSINVTNKFTCSISVSVNNGTGITITSGETKNISGFSSSASTPVEISLIYNNPPMLDQSEVLDNPAADFTNFNFYAGKMTFDVTLDENGFGAVTAEEDPDIDTGKSGIPPETED